MSIPVSKQSFINVFSKSVYNKIVKESAIEYNPSMSWKDFVNISRSFVESEKFVMC